MQVHEGLQPAGEVGRGDHETISTRLADRCFQPVRNISWRSRDLRRANAGCLQSPDVRKGEVLGTWDVKECVPAAPASGHVEFSKDARGRIGRETGEIFAQHARQDYQPGFRAHSLVVQGQLGL